MSDGFPRWLVPAGAMAVLAVLLWVVGSTGGGADPTTTTFDPDVIAITTTTPPPGTTTTGLPPSATETPPISTFPARSRPLEAAIPGLDGRLAVVVGPGLAGHTLSWVDTTTTAWEDTALPIHASEFDLDASGRILAFIDRAPHVEPTLWLLPRGGKPRVVVGSVRHYAWSGDEEGRIAWLETDPLEAGQMLLEVGTADGSEVLRAQSLGAFPEAQPAGFRLLGLTSRGHWLGSYDARVAMPFVTFFPAEVPGGIPHPGDLVVAAPTGPAALIAHLDVAGWFWNFKITDGKQTTPATWAPPQAGGEHGFAAWSGDGEALAFIGGDVSRHPGSWLEVWSPDGERIRRVEFPYRVWDVSWGPDDRFVLMPGTDDAGENVVLFYDLDDGSLDAVVFDEWVQFAALVDALRTGPLSEPGASTT